MDKVLLNIRTIRELKGYSQDYLADKLNLTQSAYARFESGKIKTDLKIVRNVADFFEMSLVDLITYPEKWVKSNRSDYFLTVPKEIKATLTIEMGKEKKDQVFRFLFGEEISNN